MSAITSYAVFMPRKTQKSYSITANSGAYYRLYAHLNGKTIIADEAIGIKLYSLEATAGDKIEIRSYSDSPFTVELAQEGPYSLIATQHAQNISIEYTIP